MVTRSCELLAYVRELHLRNLYIPFQRKRIFDENNLFFYWFAIIQKRWKGKQVNSYPHPQVCYCCFDIKFCDSSGLPIITFRETLFAYQLILYILCNFSLYVCVHVICNIDLYVHLFSLGLKCRVFIG